MAVYSRNVIDINWLPLVPGMRDTYGPECEFQIIVWLPNTFDGWDLTSIRAAVAGTVGVRVDEVMRGSQKQISMLSVGDGR